MCVFMSELFPWGGSHLFLNGFAALWIGSAAVSAMNPPCSSSGQVYQWLYRFLHLLSANLDKAGLLTMLPWGTKEAATFTN